MIDHTILHYRIVEKLGSGGMGVVYRAEDSRLGRQVALKLLSEAFSRDARAMERFQREARAASALNHPNIRTIFHFDEHEGRQFIVMELLEGQTLDQVIGGKPLPTDTILDLALQITDALEAAHAKGIVHRDIKPGNIFVTESEQVKVMDFGLAKTLPGWSEAMIAASPESQPTLDHVSLPGMPVGTAAYMSPEQIRGEPIDPRSDLFSFGAVLYEMATGQQPFVGATFGLIFEAILNRAPLPPQILNPDLHLGLRNVIRKALEKDPGARYQTVSEMRADLRRMKDEIDSGRLLARTWGKTESVPQLPPEALQPPTPESGKGIPAMRPFFRRRRFVFLGVAAALLASVMALYFLLPRTSYYPCILVGEFRIASDAVSPGLIEFALKRSLSQFAEPAVYDRREFDLARRSERSARSRASPGNNKPSWWQHLLDRQPEPATQAALVVEAEIQPSLNDLEVQLQVTNRGSTERHTLRYRGLDHLMSQGIDELARRILELYSARDETESSAQQQGYRSAQQLLSYHLDGLRHYWRGVQAWNHLEMGLAERELRTALEIDPTFALARVLLAEVRVFQNQWDAARSEIAIAEQQPSALTEADNLRIQALLARVSGKPFDERIKLEKLIGLQPHRKEYVYELAESYFHTADAEEALGKYMEALKLDDKYALAYNHLGYCYSWKGDHAQAVQAFQRYLELDRSANAYDSLADALMHSGDYQKAAELKRKAVELDPSLYYAKRSLALIEILGGRNRSAEAMLQRMLAETEKPVDKARFLAVLAFLYDRTRQLDQALQACAQGLELMGTARTDAPKDELLWLQGLIELERGRTAAANGALAQLRKMIDLNLITAANFKPVYKYWRHLQAQIKAAEGQNQQASEALDELSWIRNKLGYWSTPYDCAFLLDSIGQIRERIGQLPQAEQSYRDALQYNEHYALARYHLARLLQKSGHLSDARSELEAFLREWSSADKNAPEMLGAAETMRQLRSK